MEEAPEESTQGEEEEHYMVRRIYTKSYEGFSYNGYTAFLTGCGEHQVRLFQCEGSEAMEVAMDYRYGFYEKEPFLGISDIVNIYGLVLWSGDKESIGLEKNFLSPDGRYLIYLNRERSYVGGELCLIDLDTGETTVLLNGDEMGYSGEYFMVLTAWDRDSKLLCYGFYPRNSRIWNSQGAGRCILYYMDLESKKVINRLNYSYAGLAGTSDDLQDTRLYVDREGQKILTALVRDNSYQEGEGIDLFPQTIPDSGEMETEGVVMPSRVNCENGAWIYLDAGAGLLHVTSSYEGILTFEEKEGNFLDMLPLEKDVTVTQLLALEGGEVFITSEYTDYIDGQDICLYIKNDDGNVVRRLLYKNAGVVCRLQYDSVYHRLLVESTGLVTATDLAGETEAPGNNEFKETVNAPRTALILEF